MITCPAPETCNSQTLPMDGLTGEAAGDLRGSKQANVAQREVKRLSFLPPSEPARFENRFFVIRRVRKAPLGAPILCSFSACQVGPLTTASAFRLLQREQVSRSRQSSTSVSEPTSAQCFVFREKVRA